VPPTEAPAKESEQQSPSPTASDKEAEALEEIIPEVTKQAATSKPAQQGSSNPTQDLLLEDLRDRYLEKIPSESQRARVLKACAADPMTAQIQFIKRWAATQEPAPPAGQIPVSAGAPPAEFDVVAFSEKARAEREKRQSERMYR
jgi:hypothetical protein